MEEVNTPQKVFDNNYITSSEICEELKVSRTSIANARKTGTLPNSIAVNGLHIFIWERAQVRPFIDAWKEQLHRHGVS